MLGSLSISVRRGFHCLIRRSLHHGIISMATEGPLSPKEVKYNGAGGSAVEYNGETIVGTATETSIRDPEATPQTELTQTDRLYRRKCIILLSYCGREYMGMQRNPDVPTIEDELLDALAKANAIPCDMKYDLGKLQFQRCARTDKGVSAARQVVSLKINLVPQINQHLPEQIRIMGIQRVTKSFNSKYQCTSRIYEYLIPTYSFAPFEDTNLRYRINATVITRVQKLLNHYIGSKNFHNFTKQKSYDDHSSFRYIMSFNVGHPFIRGDVEFVTLTIEGQSFMIHQIRKMIGYVIAIVRGYIQEDMMKEAFNKPKIDIPRAPSLGLYLDSPQFTAYNRKYGSDGVHSSLDWSQYEDAVSNFKENYIHKTIIDSEIRTLSMSRWLETLHLHNFHQTVQTCQQKDQPKENWQEIQGTNDQQRKRNNY